MCGTIAILLAQKLGWLVTGAKSDVVTESRATAPERSNLSQAQARIREAQSGAVIRTKRRVR